MKIFFVLKLPLSARIVVWASLGVPVLIAAREPATKDATAEAMVQRIATREDLLAQVPGNGPLSENDLILLALANDPSLTKLRGAIAVAAANEVSEHDLPNPELRFTYGAQSDDFLDLPYTESERQALRSNESFSSTDGANNLAPPLQAGTGEYQRDTEFGRTSGTRYREITRRVTPGRYSTTVDERIVETQRNRTASSRTRVNGDGLIEGTKLEGLRDATQTRKVSHSRTTVKHPDAFGSDDSMGILLRFQIPNPWERKARIAGAAAEISLARAEYLAAEDEVVRKVRELYTDLGTSESIIGIQSKRRTGFAALFTKFEGFGGTVPDLALEAGRSKLEWRKILKDLRQEEDQQEKVRQDLAAISGLRNLSRVKTDGQVVRRIIDLGGVDAAYIGEMALLYRADLLESKARLEVATALLAREKSNAIPFATFLDAGWQRQWADGRSGERDEFFVRVGVSLPFFDWIGVNKKKNVPKEEMRQWESVVEQQSQRIRLEVELALSRLRHSARELEKYEADLREIKKDAEKSKASIAEAVKASTPAGPDPKDYAKSERLNHEFSDFALQLEMDRHKAYADYANAVMSLERAIGVRIEKVLHGSRSAK